MTCREHEDALLDLARGIAGTADSASLADHLRECPACAHRLAGERSMTAALRELAATTSESGPSDGMEQALLGEFMAMAAERQRGDGRWLWLAAAAVVALVAGSTLLWRGPARQAPAASTSASLPAREAPVETVPPALDASGAGGATSLAAPSPIPRVSRTATSRRPPGPLATTRPPEAARAASRRSSEFIAWPGAATLPAMESGELVRTELPTSVLGLLGLESKGPLSARTVVADVLVGQDGQARAVRLVEDR